jgi:hypothetical protein
MPAPVTLLPVSPGAGLPALAEPFLDAPAPGGGDFFASRTWFDTLLAHAWTQSDQPVLALCEAAGAILPLLRGAGRLASLTSPYSLAWRPLFAPGADPRAAGAAFGRALRLAPPTQLDLLDPAAPGLPAFRAGLAATRIRARAFNHVGNWHEVLPPGTGWEAYLTARPPALRTTIGRKLKRVGRELRFELIDAPGPGLEAGIAAYQTVRATSWKPFEPFPAFDAALLRAVAPLSALRLAVLRQATDSQPIAAQYWILDQAAQRATVLKLAHAEAARAASPGTVLTALMIRHLLEGDRVTILDFGRGDDEYKQLWATRRRQRIGLVLADPLHPAGALALARQAAGALRRRLRS